MPKEKVINPYFSGVVNWNEAQGETSRFALIFLPFGFVYLPPLLMGGSAIDVIYTSIILLIGFMSLAMAIQGADFINAKIGFHQRMMLGLAAMAMLLPVPKWVNLIGIGLMVGGWLPGFFVYRKALMESRLQSAD